MFSMFSMFSMNFMISNVSSVPKVSSVQDRNRYTHLYRFFYSIMISSVLVFTGIALPAFAKEQLLKTDDVHRVMGEILGQHVSQNEISEDILVKGFTVYADQFDPDRIYLLKSEVDQYQNPGDLKAKKLLENYQNKNFSQYEAFNQVIQKSIMRARKIRGEFLNDKESLFQISRQHPAQQEFEDQRAFAVNDQELRQRIKDDLINFISIERQRYGDDLVAKNKEKTINGYDRILRQKENEYLYQNNAGKALSSQERDNLFTVHILKALAKSLDSHTAFLDEDEANEMKMRLEKGFKGLGIVIEKKPQGAVISRLVKGGPAEKSGQIQVDDQIISINSVNVENASVDEVMEKLREDNGDLVNLVVRRGGDHHSGDVAVALRKEVIVVDDDRVDVSYEPFENGIIGKLTLHSFYQGEGGVTSEKDIRNAVRQLKQKGNLRGLVLDLRENGGGFLNQAVKVAGLFITNGVVVISKYSNGEEHFYRDMDGKTIFDGPMVVLTSKATASAAEIVAQALQDYGVAVVVGDEQTYGKGTIQSQTATDGGNVSKFKVTVGEYYTVSGKTPQIRGVKSDIVVPSHYSHMTLGEGYQKNLIKAGEIAPAYKDDLADIDPGLRPWYVRYYMPTLQRPEAVWRAMMPRLKDLSHNRLSNNRGYQEFITKKVEFDEKQVANMQLEEASNVVKDMIVLEDKAYRSRLADF